MKLQPSWAHSGLKSMLPEHSEHGNKLRNSMNMARFDVFL